MMTPGLTGAPFSEAMPLHPKNADEVIAVNLGSSVYTLTGSITGGDVALDAGETAILVYAGSTAGWYVTWRSATGTVTYPVSPAHGGTGADLSGLSAGQMIAFDGSVFVGAPISTTATSALFTFADGISYNFDENGLISTGGAAIFGSSDSGSTLVAAGGWSVGLGSDGSLTVALADGTMEARVGANALWYGANANDLGGTGDDAAQPWRSGYFGTSVVSPLYTSPATGDLSIVATAALANIFLTPGAGGSVFGDLTGNLTGNVTGDLSGNVTGDVTGTLTGDVVGAADVQTQSLEVTVPNGTTLAASFQNDDTSGSNDYIQLHFASSESPSIHAQGVFEFQNSGNGDGAAYFGMNFDGSNTDIVKFWNNGGARFGTDVSGVSPGVGTVDAAAYTCSAMPAAPGASGTIYADPVTHALFITP